MAELSNAQRVVAHDMHGLCAVKACPGSGKTYAVAARMSRLLKAWPQRHVGMAVMSFTNTAWQAIETYLVREFGVLQTVGYPHFLGTLDSFINRHLLLPLGHRVMGCPNRPELSGPPHDDSEPIGSWMFWRNVECNRSGCALNDFSYDEDGNLVNLSPMSHFRQCKSNHELCRALKTRFTAAGYATQNDANYFAMKLVEDYPEVAKAIARRFPVMIVDEAQDTSRIQMRLLDALVSGGLRELMIVGDPLQAIYEWRQAEPGLFEKKCNTWQDNCVLLYENWRSTQSICDCARRLANLPQRIWARNTDLELWNEPPCLYGYDDESELPGILAQFQTHCSARDIAPESISVLTRSEGFVNAVLPGTVPVKKLNPWRDKDWLTRPVANAKYLFDRGQYKEAMRLLEMAVYRHHTGHGAVRAEAVRQHAKAMGYEKWRGHLYVLLSRLPRSEGTLDAWVNNAKAVVESSSLLEGAALAIKRDRRPHVYSVLTFSDAFELPANLRERDGRVQGTVHSAKGMSLDAVLVVLKSKGACGAMYVRLLGTDLLAEEEMRIVFVAITRARKALAIAVPSKCLDSWRRYLAGDGR